MKRLFRIVVAAALACGLVPDLTQAQQRLVIEGTVQWVTSARIQIMSDAGISVSIDVSRMDQSSYTSLRGGERVKVTGVVSPDRTRLIADSLEPAEAAGGYWSSFPQAG